MKGKEMVLLISTFLMGMLAGAYLYVSVFATSYEGFLQQEDIKQDSFVINGVMYGACEAEGTCASFQLIEGRDYNYSSHSDAQVQKGKLPGAYRSILEDTLNEETLSSNSIQVEGSQCSSQIGGVDYTYTVSYGGEQYVLDTCRTLLASNLALQEVLLEVWFALENPNAQAPQAPLPDFNIGNIIFDRFNNPN